MIIFCDVETGGLNPNHHALLEICFIPIDADFNMIGEFRRTIGFEGQAGIIDEFCAKMHTKNNLLEECKVSRAIDYVEKELKDWLCDRGVVPDDPNGDGSIVLGGSSVHFDKKFLLHYFPWIKNQLHYRVYDVRSLLQTLDVNISLPCPKDEHRALPDCINALYTARHYREMLIWAKANPQ